MKGSPPDFKGKHPFTPYRGFTPGTTVLPNSTSARWKYIPAVSITSCIGPIQLSHMAKYNVKNYRGCSINFSKYILLISAVLFLSLILFFTLLFLYESVPFYACLAIFTFIIEDTSCIRPYPKMIY